MSQTVSKMIILMDLRVCSIILMKKFTRVKNYNLWEERLKEITISQKKLSKMDSDSELRL